MSRIAGAPRKRTPGLQEDLGENEAAVRVPGRADSRPVEIPLDVFPVRIARQPGLDGLGRRIPESPVGSDVLRRAKVGDTQGRNPRLESFMGQRLNAGGHPLAVTSRLLPDAFVAHEGRQAARLAVPVHRLENLDFRFFGQAFLRDRGGEMGTVGDRMKKQDG
jgi:hypothetical protein